MKKALLILMIIFLIFFLNMCIVHIPKDHYVLLAENTFISTEEKEKVYKTFNFKRIYLTEDQSIEFYIFDNPKVNLELVRVEIFYENKMVGMVIINKKMDDLDSYGADFLDETGRKIFTKICFLEKDFFRIMGKDYEIYNKNYPNGKFEIAIYLRNLKTNEILKVNRKCRIYFEKEGYELFIPSV